MELNEDIFVRLMIAAFGLTLAAFIVRGTSRIVVSPDTAAALSTPVFVLAMLCAAAGFVLAVVIKVQSIRAAQSSR
ncbi:hypothetical protein [Halovenus halobia]|uniref:hypothetical protein n=1 Tax=Halovenus halobia TaxID=3396622 RepID=UPI003F54E3B3